MRAIKSATKTRANNQHNVIKDAEVVESIPGTRPTSGVEDYIVLNRSLLIMFMVMRMQLANGNFNVSHIKTRFVSVLGCFNREQ